MMRFFPALVLAFVVVVGFGAPSYAVTWPSLPAACTPDRAMPWQAGKSGQNQSQCHCPPASMCPTTYAGYSDATKSPMPMSVIARCCPEIKPESCPAGTALAGQPMPSDGECNPKCPAGTTLAGQPVPQNGQCNPVACPSKFYPTMTQASMQGVPVGEGGTYTYQDGSKYNFSGDGINQLFYKNNEETKALAQKYGYSIRAGDPSYWQLGPGFMCQALGNGWCPFENFYIPGTNGVNNGTKLLKDVVGAIGADKLVWFGFSVVKESYLANNLVTPAIVAGFAGKDRIALADHSCPLGGLCMGGSKKLAIPKELTNDAPGFVEQCDKAAGEFIEMETAMISGNRCQYLQCRYVYENTAESCLEENTKVTLADGTSKAVKDLKLGDVVKGSGGDHKIVAANTYQSALRVLYGINGGAALLTGDHPLHTKDGWKVINVDAAKLHAGKNGFAKTELKVGDVLITDKGEVVVKSIDRHAKVDPIATYNIKVEGNAGFYANGIEVKGFDKMEMKYE